MVMKRLASVPFALALAVAFLASGTATPGWGQRGGAHGGGVGRVASISHGAPSLSSHFTYASSHAAGPAAVYYPAYRPLASPSVRPGLGFSGYAARRPVSRPVNGLPGHGEPDRRRTTYVAFPYAVTVPYEVDPGPAYGAAQPYPPDYAADPGGSAAGYGPGPMGQMEAPPAAAYRPASASSPEDDVTVTLIFKDGRPAEQIHNYILTQKTLYVQDERHRTIPVEQIDLASTEKANLDAGVEFHLPGSSKWLGCFRS